MSRIFRLLIYSTTLVFAASLHAQLPGEPVVRFGGFIECKDPVLCDGAFWGNALHSTTAIGFQPVEGAVSPSSDVFTDLMKKNVTKFFWVYTKDDVESRLKDVVLYTDSSVSNAKKEITLALTQAVNAIPQRLLTDDAKTAVIQAVLAETQKQIDGATADLITRLNQMSTQLNALQKKVDSMAPNPAPPPAK